MTRTFNDKEFRMIGAIQSFYYRCWSMFGGGRETPRRIGQTEIDLINRWGYNLFNDLSVHDYRIEVIDENVLEAGERLYVNLVINPHIGLDRNSFDGANGVGRHRDGARRSCFEKQQSTKELMPSFGAGESIGRCMWEKLIQTTPMSERLSCVSQAG